MFNTNINISVIAATGLGNEILVKPRQGKKLLFASQSKQARLTQELKDSYDKYSSVLTANSWTILLYLHKHRLPASAQELVKLIESTATSEDKFISEFKYRLEWLVQLGLLDRPSFDYEISTVGDALIGIAQTRSSSETPFGKAVQRVADAPRISMVTD